MFNVMSHMVHLMAKLVVHPGADFYFANFNFCFWILASFSKKTEIAKMLLIKELGKILSSFIILEILIFLNFSIFVVKIQNVQNF